MNLELIGRILDIDNKIILNKVNQGLLISKCEALRHKLNCLEVNDNGCLIETARSIFREIIHDPYVFKVFMDNDIPFKKAINTHFCCLENSNGLYKIYDVNTRNFLNMSHEDSMIVSYWCFRTH